MISEDNLNRIGILLNFAAGFMLSPALLGLERLRRLEQWAERTLESIRRVVRGADPAGMILGVLVLSAGGFAVLVTLAQLNPTIDRVASLPYDPVVYVLSLITPSTIAKFVAALLYILSLAILVWVCLQLLALSADRAARSLEGDDRLISWMTGAGIIVFIVGNALQFAATFHPGH